MCITAPYRAETSEDEWMLTWEKESRTYFTQCRKCDRFVMDAECSPLVFDSTDSAPFEYETKGCKNCGTKIDVDSACLRRKILPPLRAVVVFENFH